MPSKGKCQARSMAAYGKGKQKLGIQKGADLLKKAGLAEKIKGLKAAAKKKFEGAGQGRKRKQWMEAQAKKMIKEAASEGEAMEDAKS